MGGGLLRCGRRTAKGVTGYDLVAGFVGSEGTFGVITELVIKRVPKPPAAATVLGVFADVATAGAAIEGLLKHGLRPRALEIADRASIDHIRSKSRYRFPANAGAIVLLGATEASERAKVWEARRLISPALKAGYRIKVNEDICVPRGRIVQM